MEGRFFIEVKRREGRRIGIEKIKPTQERTEWEGVKISPEKPPKSQKTGSRKIIEKPHSCTQFDSGESPKSRIRIGNGFRKTVEKQQTYGGKFSEMG